MSSGEMQQILPGAHTRRSQLARWHAQRGAVFGLVGDAVVVDQYAPLADERMRAQQLGLVDLSTLPRVGFKGQGTPDWLRAQGWVPPSQANTATAQNDGALMAALSTHEVLVLSDLAARSEAVSQLTSAYSAGAPTRSYILPRADSHACLALCGQHAAEMLAKVCGVDLRPGHFENHQVAQTSLARVNAIIIRDDLGQTLSYHILSDVSSIEFLWDSLLDAAIEFDGAPIGVQALHALRA